MKKMLVFVAAFVSVFLMSVGGGPSVGAISTNNFTISSYQIDYYLGRDSANHSTLKTVERIVADFPSYDQNHGIERYVPTSYDGHTTGLSVSSVTDENGAAIHYSTYGSNDNEVLRIGNASQYVHGSKTYLITYTQQDVTKFYNDTNSDEFYWDTNGTGWGVPISRLSVSLHIGSDLSNLLNGNKSCYVGTQGSSTPCEITASGDGFYVSVDNLAPGENVTLAVGFKPQTFATYTVKPLDQAKMYWLIFQFTIAPILMLIFTIILIVWYLKAHNRRKDIGTIIPEYLPPNDASVTVSAAIYNRQNTAFSAQLIDFAVRHYIRIYQTQEKTLFKPAQYELEIIKDVSDLRDEEREILNDMFGNPSVGARLNLQDLQNNRLQTYVKFSDNAQKLNADIKGIYGLRVKDPAVSSKFKRLGTITLIIAILTLSPGLLAVAVASYLTGIFIWPLSDRGVELRRYLEGLKLYISVAETDRIRMLQSPEGAEKLDAPIDANDQRQLVKLYERVLPYAILFNKEKNWNNQLGRYYESINQSPDWYVGHNAVFNAAVFSAAMNSFGAAVSSTNSSTGGSAGGGFSGGGGGGGGGGGW